MFTSRSVTHREINLYRLCARSRLSILIKTTHFLKKCINVIEKKIVPMDFQHSLKSRETYIIHNFQQKITFCMT